MNLGTLYDTITHAEAVLREDGYIRSPGAAMWIKPGAVSLKVIRTPENKFQLAAK